MISKEISLKQLKEWEKNNPQKVKEAQRRYTKKMTELRDRNIEAIKYIKMCQDSGLLFSHIVYKELLDILEGNNENKGV